MTSSSLPASWTRCLLGDVINYGTTEKAEPSDIPEDGWILELDDIEKDTSKVLTRAVFAQRKSKSTKNRFQRGDVLYGKLRPYLNKVIRADSDGYCSTEILPLRPPSAICRDYLFHWLKSPVFLEYVGEVSHGLNMPRLGTEAGRKAPFVLAPLNEQRRIANKLDAVLARVDACRERLDRIPAILKSFRQSVLAAATSGKLTEDWREERGLADEWEETDIQSIASLGTGSTPLRSNRAFYADSGMPWITSAATSKPVVTEASEFVTAEAIAAHRLKIYSPGTLLVAMYGEGKTRGQVTELRISATINQACAAIAVDERKAIREFVKIALEANYLEMRDLAEGGNQPNLNLTKIKGFPIKLPSIAEQQLITERVALLTARASLVAGVHASVNAKVTELTPRLLAIAFRGDLAPQDPNDEPACVLLERIRAERAASSPRTRRSKGGRRARTDKKPEVAMLNRTEIHEKHLSEILRERGPLTSEALWSASQLGIDDFYDQLKDEEARGLVVERRSDAPTAPRMLEAAA